MKNGLIGFSGFVGSTLLKQAHFDLIYRSTNIHEIDGENFETIVCAGAPAQKWLANLEPEKDREQIESLIEHLKTIQCKNFILISSVDVFQDISAVNEGSLVEESGLHPYGLHRRMLEKFVEKYFPKYLIVRLPGLVGPGLRKNIIFDFLNNNNLHSIDSRGIFQFYPMVNLWFDIQIALKADLKLIHLTAEPISVSDIAMQCFGKTIKQVLANKVIVYNFQTKYASIFGSQGQYQYMARETILAVRAYAQSEPLTLKQS